MSDFLILSGLVLLVIALAVWVRKLFRRIDQFYKELNFEKIIDGPTFSEATEAPSINAQSWTELQLMQRFKQSLPIKEHIVYGPSAYTGQYKNLAITQISSGMLVTIRLSRRGMNRQRRKPRFTVTMVQSNQTLPYFLIEPRSLSNKLAMHFTGNNTNFSNDAQFDKAYSVFTHQHEKTQTLLGPELRQLLLESNGLSVECAGNHLLLMREPYMSGFRKGLKDELNAAVVIHDYLIARTSSTID